MKQQIQDLKEFLNSFPTNSLSESILTGFSVIFEAEREGGKRLSAYPRYAGLSKVTLYRAQSADSNILPTDSYTTMSPKFAIEHTESNHIYEDEQQIVIRVVVNPKDVADATNPGEYLYKGSPVKGTIAYKTKGYEFDSEEITDITKSILTEGVSDLKNLSIAKSTYNTVIQTLGSDRNLNYTQFTDNGLIFYNESLNIPFLLFSIDNPLINDAYGSAYDDVNDYIKINIFKNKTEYLQCMKSSDVFTLSTILKKYIDVFIHEFIHCLDSKYKGSRHKLINAYYVEKSATINKLLTSVSKDEIPSVPDNVTDYNNNTERNAYTIQYIWLCIDKLLHKPDIILTYDDFIKPLIDSKFYKYFITESKIKVNKRLFYIWSCIKSAMPDLMLLDDQRINEFRDKLLGLDSIISNDKLVESVSDKFVKRRNGTLDIITNILTIVESTSSDVYTLNHIKNNRDNKGILTYSKHGVISGYIKYISDNDDINVVDICINNDDMLDLLINRLKELFSDKYISIIAPNDTLTPSQRIIKLNSL